MRLLLDTHALLWTLSDPSSLTSRSRERLERADSTVLVSVVSTWEMEIKRALGKLEVPDDLLWQMKRLRFLELPLHIRHVQQLRKLPQLHRDPFDRMLIAQALADDLTIVTRDQRILSYSVKSLVC